MTNAANRHPARRDSGPPAKRCAIYTRKSTTKGLDQEFSSIDAQRASCEAYITSHAQQSWKVIAEHYDDGGFTGKNVDRPAFQRLLADIAAGRIDMVVVYKLDRLSRSLLDFAQIMARFSAANVDFVAVTQNFSTADAIGRLTLHLLMSFSEFEREMIAERTRDKMGAARRRGKWTGGVVPLGYQVEGKKLVVDAPDAALVRDIFRLYLLHGSALAVSQVLTEEHRAARRREQGLGRGTHSRWTKNNILRILANPVYAGFIPYGEERHEGEHEAIIDRGAFQRAQSLLAAQRRAPGLSGRNPAFLLGGVLRCQGCGAAMTSASNTRRTRVYRYYRCTTRDKQGASACTTHPVAAEGLETAIVAHLRERVRTDAFVSDVTIAARQRLDDERAGLAVERAAIPGHIARLTHDGRRLAHALIDTEGGARLLLEGQADACAQDLAAAEERQRQVERKLEALAAADTDLAWVTTVLGDFDRVWDLLTVANRARLLHALVARVETDGRAWRVQLADVGGDAGGWGDSAQERGAARAA